MKKMKKMKIQVVNHGEVIHFVNNGNVNGAPIGATIAARVKAANTVVSPSGIVTTWLTVEVKNPQNGHTFTLRVNDAQIINDPTMMSVEIPALYEVGTFECKGVLVTGYVEKVSMANVYSPFDTTTVMVVTEEGKTFDNCTVAKNLATVWGLV